MDLVGVSSNEITSWGGGEMHGETVMKQGVSCHRNRCE